MKNVLRIGFAGLAFLILSAAAAVIAAVAGAFTLALDYGLKAFDAALLALPFWLAWNLGPAALGLPKATYVSAFGVCFILNLVKPYITAKTLKLTK